MKSQLFIPKTIRVGFNRREDTYTKKLAYVIYYDAKGKLRKETSWKNWIQLPGHKARGNWNNDLREYAIDSILGKEYAPEDFENVPTEGFVLNKGVGGTRESWGWNTRNEYIRVYDPRGWEFEISIANLIFILQECTSSKGKGLEGEFIYSWAGKELVLLPCETVDYKESKEFTGMQTKKVTKADMLAGSIYIDKNQNRLIYLGRFDYRVINYRGSHVKKFHVFWDIEKKVWVPHTGFVKLAIRETTTCVDNYAEMVDEFKLSKYGSYAVSLFDKPTTLNRIENNGKNQSGIPDLHHISYSINNHIYKKDGDTYYRINIHTNKKYNINHDWDHNSEYILIGYNVIKRAKLVLNKKTSEVSLIDNTPHYYNNEGYNKLVQYTEEEINNMEFVNVYVKLESGGEILVDEFNKI